MGIYTKIINAVPAAEAGTALGCEPAGGVAPAVNVKEMRLKRNAALEILRGLKYFAVIAQGRNPGEAAKLPVQVGLVKVPVVKHNV